MKKEDLKVGLFVKLSKLNFFDIIDHIRYIVVEEKGDKIIKQITPTNLETVEFKKYRDWSYVPLGEYFYLGDFDNDLITRRDYGTWDYKVAIVQVATDYEFKNIIWERK